MAVPARFFEALPDDVLAAFEGEVDPVVRLLPDTCTFL